MRAYATHTLNAIIHHFTKASSQNTLRKCLWHTNTCTGMEKETGEGEGYRDEGITEYDSY